MEIFLRDSLLHQSSKCLLFCVFKDSSDSRSQPQHFWKIYQTPSFEMGERTIAFSLGDSGNHRPVGRVFFCWDHQSVLFFQQLPLMRREVSRFSQHHPEPTSQGTLSLLGSAGQSLAVKYPESINPFSPYKMIRAHNGPDTLLVPPGVLITSGGSDYTVQSVRRHRGSDKPHEGPTSIPSPLQGGNICPRHGKQLTTGTVIG